MGKTLDEYAKRGEYPEEIEEPCPYCGEVRTLTRHGDGREWRGRRNYSYSTAHDCDEMKHIREAHLHE